MCYSINSCHQDLLYRHFFLSIYSRHPSGSGKSGVMKHPCDCVMGSGSLLTSTARRCLASLEKWSLQNSEPDVFVGFLFKEADEILNFSWIHKAVWQRTYLLDNPKRYCILWSCYTMFLESVGANVPVYLLWQLLFLLLCGCKLFCWCRKNNIINVIIGRLKAVCNKPLYSRQTDINGSLISTELVICITCLIISCQNGCCEKDK